LNQKIDHVYQRDQCFEAIMLIDIG